MKRLTASDARRNWFRLLDEVAAGETVVIERKGRRIVIRRAGDMERQGEDEKPDYHLLLRVPEADRADRWSWDRSAASGELILREDCEQR